MASLTPDRVVELHTLHGKPVTIDDVFRLRAEDEEQSPILAYAKHPGSLTEYELFTGKHLDNFINQTCWWLISTGIDPNGRQTVALFGESDLSYSITMIALLRLGCRVMTISTRLGFLATRSLLERVECTTMLHGNSMRVMKTVGDIQAELSNIELRSLPSRSVWETPDVQNIKPFVRDFRDEEAEGQEIALIMHSSGSTGYPKPLYQCHQGVLGDLLTGMGLHAFNPLPWFHLHGFLTSLQAIYMKKTAYLWNVELPITADNLVTALTAVGPEIFHGVPYTVKVLAEHPLGIELLRKCKHVTSGGARPPDELGDFLVGEGVNFSTTFGLTETGHIGDSMRREKGDTKSWCYLRLHSYAAAHTLFVPLPDGNGEFEAVFLKTHPALRMSNSDDPPGSYHSGDIFVPHPTIANAWKYVARKDDCITLANGEKINPQAIEGILRQHSLVRDALMFGIDRLVPGMLIFKAESAASKSDEEYMLDIQSALDEANALADSFARISSDMVIVIPQNIDYPKTDKSNIIRAATYRLFEDDIGVKYQDAEKRQVGQSSINLQAPMSIPELQGHLKSLFQQLPGVTIQGVDADLFAAGVDSLQAVQVRNSILRDLNTGDAHLPANFVYDSRTISTMAARIFHMSSAGAQNMTTGLPNANGVDGGSVADATLRMQRLIDEHRPPPYFGDRPMLSNPSEEVVILTGSTGALGAHLLRQLLHRSSVRHVYCLVRGASSPLQRVMNSLAKRGIDIISELGTLVLDRLSALHTADMSAPHLGLNMDIYHQLRSHATLIIHAAWPVNFQIPLESFAPHISGLRNLLDFSLAVPWKQPARVLYTSSVAAAMQTPRQPNGDAAIIAEDQIPSLSYCLSTGYGQSKLVCERICDAYAEAGAHVGVLRIGQIVGDTQNGIWNATDALASIVQSGLVLGVLPRFSEEVDVCSWMPVDNMATACLQATFGASGRDVDIPQRWNTEPACKAIYYNLIGVESFSWNGAVLPRIKAAGIPFETVTFAEWHSRVTNYIPREPGMTEAELPVAKLNDYLLLLFGDEAQVVRFDTAKACQDLDIMGTCTSIIKSNLLEKFVRSWLPQWGVSAERAV